MLILVPCSTGVIAIVRMSQTGLLLHSTGGDSSCEYNHVPIIFHPNTTPRWQRTPLTLGCVSCFTRLDDQGISVNCILGWSGMWLSWQLALLLCAHFSIPSFVFPVVGSHTFVEIRLIHRVVNSLTLIRRTLFHCPNSSGLKDMGVRTTS